MTPLDVVDRGDCWELPVGGVRVAECCVDFAVSIRLSNEVSVRIEQPFVYTTAEGVDHLIVPEGDPVRLAPVLTVARLAVGQGAAFKDGHLELRFDDGSLLSVPATEDLEPWEIVGPDGLRVVSVPGGELAVWRPKVGFDATPR
jgi:hypothetical protein